MSYFKYDNLEPMTYEDRTYSRIPYSKFKSFTPLKRNVFHGDTQDKNMSYPRYRCHVADGTERQFQIEKDHTCIRNNINTWFYPKNVIEFWKKDSLNPIEPIPSIHTYTEDSRSSGVYDHLGNPSAQTFRPFLSDQMAVDSFLTYSQHQPIKHLKPVTELPAYSRNSQNVHCPSYIFEQKPLTIFK